MILKIEKSPSLPPPIVPNSPDNGELDDKGSAKQAQ